MFRIKDEFAAYCFDRAVSSFGGAVDRELDNAQNGAKSKTQAVMRRNEVLTRFFGEGAGRFRDPARGGGPVQL